MRVTQDVIEKRIHLSADRAERLNQLAQIRQISEDQIVERALDILFALSDILEEGNERQGWSYLSEASLQRVWNNDKDAIYDDWRDLYDAPER